MGLRGWCIVMFAATVLAASSATAEEKTDLAKALEYLEGIEPPIVGALVTYDCEDKWWSDPYCKAINDVYRLKDDRYVGIVKRSVTALRLKRSGRRASAMIGKALVDLGSCHKALPWLEAAAHIKDASGALADLVHCVAFRGVGGDRERALRLAELYAQYHNTAWAWWAAARLNFFEGRYAIARDRADRIVHVAPDYFRAWSFYADMLERFEDYPGAIRSYKESIRLRRKLSAKKAETTDSLESLHRKLAESMVEHGQYQAADKILASLDASPDEDERKVALQRRVRLHLWWKGVKAARALLTKSDVTDPELEQELAFAEAKASDDISFQPPATLGVWSQIAWWLLQHENERAVDILSAAVRDGTLSRKDFGVLDFRLGRCGSIARANSLYVGSRPDAADLWEQAMISARWTANCGNKPATDYTIKNIPPARAALAKSIHKAAVELETGAYANLARTLADLPETGPPVYHVFRMWTAAATSDHRSFEVHRKRAQGGYHSSSYLLAPLFLALRRGDAAKARKIWDSLPAGVRQPTLISRLEPVMRRHVVIAAAEVDPDFATELAEAWFVADGAIERGVWRHLRAVPTGFAVR